MERYSKGIETGEIRGCGARATGISAKASAFPIVSIPVASSEIRDLAERRRFHRTDPITRSKLDTREISTAARPEERSRFKMEIETATKFERWAPWKEKLGNKKLKKKSGGRGE